MIARLPLIHLQTLTSTGDLNIQKAIFYANRAKSGLKQNSKLISINKATAKK
jgi:hypothetical protein